MLGAIGAWGTSGCLRLTVARSKSGRQMSWSGIHLHEAFG